MDNNKKHFKTTISYQGRSVTVDLRRIVAINHPKQEDKFFRVYFENAVWNVTVDQHEKLYNAWVL